MADRDDAPPPDWLAGLRARATAGDRPRDRPVGRWLGDFLDQPGSSGLLAAELALLQACARGDGWTAPPPPPPPGGPGPGARVRAGFLRFLAMGGDDNAPVHEAGVQLTGAFVDGDIDLRGARCVDRLILLACIVNGALKIEDATLGILSLDGSRIQGLLGNRASIAGSVFLQGGFICDGPVSLFGARIGGSLQASGASINGPPGKDAVVCTGAEIRGNVALDAVFRARGAVWFNRADIGGDLNAAGGAFASDRGRALICDDARIAGSLRLTDVIAAGAVTLKNARVGGDVEAVGAVLTGRDNGAGVREAAVDATSAVIGRCLTLAAGTPRGETPRRFIATGGAVLAGVDIGQDLRAAGGLFDSQGAVALDLTAAHLGGSAWLTQAMNGETPAGRFECRGQADLSGATIDGDLFASGGLFAATAGAALLLDRARIGGQVCLTQVQWRGADRLEAGARFEAHGPVSLYAARIAGHLNCEGGLFTTSEPAPGAAPAVAGVALQGEILEVGGCVFLSGPELAEAARNPALAAFESVGEVKLHAARIAMQLSCLGGRLGNPTPDPHRPGAAAFALNLEAARIGYQMLLGPTDEDGRGPVRLHGSLNLAGAAAHGLSDKGFIGPHGPTPDCFPDQIPGSALACEAVLDGFTYERLDSGAWLGLAPRRAWLMRQPAAATGEAFLHQPFDHLASALEAMGRGEAARRIRICKEDRLTGAVAGPDKAIALGLLAVEAALFWNGLVWPGVAGILLAMLIAIRWRRGARSAEWLWRRTFGGLVAYGYRPGRGLAAALVVALVCGAFYDQAARGGALAPAGGKGEAPGAAALFHPYVYSLDVMLPVAKLGAAEAWKPTGRGFTLRAAPGPGAVVVDAAFTQKIVWLETAFGWLAGGILVAMVSGLVKTGGGAGRGASGEG